MVTAMYSTMVVLDMKLKDELSLVWKCETKAAGTEAAEVI